jgi:hypothetical protein
LAMAVVAWGAPSRVRRRRNLAPRALLLRNKDCAASRTAVAVG